MQLKLSELSQMSEDSPGAALDERDELVNGQGAQALARRFMYEV